MVGASPPRPAASSTESQPRADRRRRLLYGALATAFVIALPLYFAGAGLRAYFTNDDMMNLYGSWSKPWQDLLAANLQYWSPFYRPMGALFYRSAFAVFGFDPFPFHVACFVLMFVNLAILYNVVRALSNSREIAVLSVFVAAYHGEIEDLYYNTGTIYDLLCFFFYWLAFLLYIRWRPAGLSWPRLAIVALLYICALNSKEMAVTFPMALLAYELIFHTPEAAGRGLLRWLMRDAQAGVLLGIMTIPYVLGKMSQSSIFYYVGDYQVELSAARYIRTYGQYLEKMFYLAPGTFGVSETVLLFVLLGAVAVLTRARVLLFAYLFTLFSVLPVIFITPRGTMFVLYVSYVGWSLCFASLAVLTRDAILRRVSRFTSVRVSGVPALAVLAAVGLFSLHAANARTVITENIIRPFREQMHAAVPVLSANSRVLLLDDPFGTGEWTPVFVVRLSYGSPAIVVDRVKMMPAPPDAAAVRGYDVVLTWKDGKLVRLT
jgi:hypothetical protein